VIDEYIFGHTLSIRLSHLCIKPRLPLRPAAQNPLALRGSGRARPPRRGQE